MQAAGFVPKYGATIGLGARRRAVVRGTFARPTSATRTRIRCWRPRFDQMGLVLLEGTVPREHVGESLLPASIPILETLACEEVQAARFVPMYGATMV